MDGLLAGLEYVGVDIDPAVVQVARSESGGANFYVADRELQQLADDRCDAIVSAFVFHFRLPRLHLDTMRRILAPGGIILANVYRRTPRSRRELMAEFNRVGLRVVHMPDEADLCADQEFWCLTHTGSADLGRSETALLAVHEATGAADRCRTPAISVNGAPLHPPAAAGYSSERGGHRCSTGPKW
jgi:SAM-dependent methyltransferase